MTMLWHTDETEQALLEKKMVQFARARLSQRQISHWKVVIGQTRLEDWFVSMPLHRPHHLLACLLTSI